MSSQLLRCVLVLAVLLRRATAAEQSDIVFGDPDLSTTISSEHGEVQLDAFKAAHNDRILQSNDTSRLSQLQWFSLGEPQLVRRRDRLDPSKEVAVNLKANTATVKIRTLTASHRSELARSARKVYGETVSERQFLALPLSNLHCQVAMRDDVGHLFLLTGKPSNLQAYTIRIDFVAPKTSPERRLLESLLKNHPDELSVDCTFYSKGREVRKNAFELSPEQMGKLEIVEKLFGPSDYVHVTHWQLAKIASEVYSAMSILEEYAMPLYEFTDAFISGLLQQTMDKPFSDVDVDVALAGLSTYAHEDMLDPGDIKDALSSLFGVETTKKSRQIVVKQSTLAAWSQRDGTSALATITALFGIAVSPSSRMSTPDFTSPSKSLKEQLAELNSFPEYDIRWEVDGNRLVPRNIRVAKLWREGFTRTLHFSRVFREEIVAPFSRTVRLEVGDSVPTQPPSDDSQAVYQQELLQEITKLKSDVDQLMKKSQQKPNQADAVPFTTLATDLGTASYYGSRLHWASQKNQTDAFTMLLDEDEHKHGAADESAEVSDGDGHHHNHDGHRHLDNPLDPKQPGKRTLTLSELMAGFKAKSYNGSRLHWASQKGLTDAVTMLLDEGERVDAKNKEGQTPLHLASMKGRVEVVSLLLDRGADIEAKDKEDYTPLLHAVVNGRPGVLRILLARGAHTDVREADFQGTPLHFASETGRTDIVKLLLDNGADMEAKDNEDESPLHWASDNGQVDVIKILLKRGANADSRNEEGNTPLASASFRGQLDVVKVLLDNKANIDVHNAKDFNHTPLLEAIGQGKTDVAKMLIELGANIESRSDEDNTPLAVASGLGHVAIVKELLKKGANYDARSAKNSNYTPLLVAIERGKTDVAKMLIKHGASTEARSDRDQTPLNLASQLGHVEIVSALLDNGAHIDEKSAKNFHNTPLLMAIERGHVDVALMLIDRGAGIEARNDEDNTPLAVASYLGHVAIVKALLDNRANIETRSAKYFHHTPLLMAIERGNLEMVKLLIDRGANVNVRDAENRTALDYADITGHKKIASFLRQHGGTT